MNLSTEAGPQGHSLVSASEWMLFFGLSRTPHGLLDLATPAMAALLWLGHFPPLSVTIVGLITAFAGYTAVYALNDLVDFQADVEKLALRQGPKDLFDLDEMMVVNPVAKGLLPFRRGLAWCLIWGVVALVGAWWLNPFCTVLFAVTACLETVYCKLLKVTHLKIVPSAMVKSMGGIAGVYAVDPEPSLGFLAVLVLWLAAWEVGGQNIANDIVDLEQDREVAARTTATVKGLTEAVFRLLAAVSMAVAAGIAIYWLAGSGVGRLYPVGAIILGWVLLLKPARQVYYSPSSATAASLFNKASYMPLSFLGLVALCICL